MRCAYRSAIDGACRSSASTSPWLQPRPRRSAGLIVTLHGMNGRPLADGLLFFGGDARQNKTGRPPRPSSPIQAVNLHAPRPTIRMPPAFHPARRRSARSAPVARRGARGDARRLRQRDVPRPRRRGRPPRPRVGRSGSTRFIRIGSRSRARLDGDRHRRDRSFATRTSSPRRAALRLPQLLHPPR